MDRERFPSFTNELREAMFQEPIRFIDDVVRNDRSVLDLLYGELHLRQSGAGHALRHAGRDRRPEYAGSGWTMRGATAAAACCPWRYS